MCSGWTTQHSNLGACDGATEGQGKGEDAAGRICTMGAYLSTPPGDIQARRPPEGACTLGQHTPQSAYKTSIFERFEADDAAALIAEYPLAWLCPCGSGQEDATLLPLLAEGDAGGRITRLIGHMARTNPLWPRLLADPAALILFQGPQAYISPAVVGRRDWVPTWNFAQLRVEARIAFQPDKGDAALAMIVEAMERAQPDPWRIEETGPRYGRMVQSIIAFEAHVTSIRGRFKLGQDETPETLRSILANHPDAALVRWMKRFNQGRY